MTKNKCEIFACNPKNTWLAGQMWKKGSRPRESQGRPGGTQRCAVTKQSKNREKDMIAHQDDYRAIQC